MAHPVVRKERAQFVLYVTYEERVERMEWQAIVLAVQILLLAAGWILFQRARGELSVRAAETPVLGEVKALQKNVKELLVEIETTADKQSARLERICADAASVLSAIEIRIQDADAILSQLEARPAAGPAALLNAARRYDGRNEASIGPASIAPGHNGPYHAIHVQRQENVSATPESITTPISMNDGLLKRRELVFSMADNGQSAAAIAEATRLSEGEVEALLGLRIKR